MWLIKILNVKYSPTAASYQLFIYVPTISMPVNLTSLSKLTFPSGLVWISLSSHLLVYAPVLLLCAVVRFVQIVPTVYCPVVSKCYRQITSIWTIIAYSGTGVVQKCHLRGHTLSLLDPLRSTCSVPQVDGARAVCFQQQQSTAPPRILNTFELVDLLSKKSPFQSESLNPREHKAPDP